MRQLLYRFWEISYSSLTITLSVVKVVYRLCFITWTKLNCDSKSNCMIQSNRVGSKFKNLSRQKFGKSATKIFYCSSVEGILNVIIEQGMLYASYYSFCYWLACCFSSIHRTNRSRRQKYLIEFQDLETIWIRFHCQTKRTLVYTFDECSFCWVMRLLLFFYGQKLRK